MNRFYQNADENAHLTANSSTMNELRAIARDVPAPRPSLLSRIHAYLSAPAFSK